MVTSMREEAAAAHGGGGGAKVTFHFIIGGVVLGATKSLRPGLAEDCAAALKVLRCTFVDMWYGLVAFVRDNGITHLRANNDFPCGFLYLTRQAVREQISDPLHQLSVAGLLCFVDPDRITPLQAHRPAVHRGGR